MLFVIISVYFKFTYKLFVWHEKVDILTQQIYDKVQYFSIEMAKMMDVDHAAQTSYEALILLEKTKIKLKNA